ncbi:MAG: hypothetical protein M9921_15645 [Fimbriimonadaceae bacterium]|nr:hypothetical protein [Fimbriimonadaceae bacterium]
MATDKIATFIARRSERLGRATRLRPMRASEILDLSLRVYQQMGWTFLKHTVVPALLALAAAIFVWFNVVPAFTTTNHPESVTAQLAELAAALGLAILVAVPLVVGALAAASATVTLLTSDFMAGNTPNPAAARARARESVVPLMWVALRVGAFSASGVVLCGVAIGGAALIDATTRSQSLWLPVVVGLAFFALIPAIGGMLWGLSRYSLAVPAVVLERLGAGQACRRSLALMGGRPSGYDTMHMLWAVLGMVTLVILGGLSLSVYLLGIHDWIEMARPLGFVAELLDSAVSLLPWFALIWVAIPVWCTTSTLLFYERRIRLEGYDIDALAQEIWRAQPETRFQL